MRHIALLGLSVTGLVAGLRGILMEVSAIQAAYQTPSAEYVDLARRGLEADPNILIMALFIAPFFEEIVFRWLGFKVLALVRVGGWVAIALTATIFAAVHPPLQILPALVFGLFAGHLYVATKNIGWPMFAHWIWNLTGTLDLFWFRERLETLLAPGFVYQPPHFPLLYLVAMSCLCAGALYAYVRLVSKINRGPTQALVLNGET